MKNFAVLSTVTLFCVLISFSLTQAQNSLTHNTGTLEVTIIDNGYIADDASGTYGGVVFNGNQNAMYTAGFMIGLGGEAWGNIGSFLIEDFQNYIPITGFYPNPFFNEISNHTFNMILSPDAGGKITSLSNTNQDFVFIRADAYNNTAAFTSHPGIFADWDVGNFLLNRGGYDPAMNLIYMYENGGGTDASYYGIVGIAVNGAAMDPNTIAGTIIGDFPWDRAVAFGHMTSTTFDPITTDGDYRMFISFGEYFASLGETITVDLAIVAGTSLADLQDNALAAIEYGPNIPVELTSFTAVSNGGKVHLNWSTATETNNLGFEIERKVNNESQWIKRAFKEGFGTTAEPKEYSYIDDVSDLGAASIYYRLKQIDFDGSYEYSDEVFVANVAPVEFVLGQNYPNPFNPSTTISYGIPVESIVVLKLYNSLGEEVTTLVNEEKTAGRYEIEFNASALGGLSSGVYFYRLQVYPANGGAGSFIDTKKFILMK